MRTKYLVILPVLWVLFLFSCGNEKQEPSSTDEVEQKGNSKYGDVDFILPELDLISRSHVANWAVYEDFDNEVRLINGRSKDVLKNKTRRLVTHIDSLSKKNSGYPIQSIYIIKTTYSKDPSIPTRSRT